MHPPRSATRTGLPRREPAVPLLNRIDGDTAALATEVDALLAVARRLNAAADITGVLMFNTGVFVQVLEGPHDAVSANLSVSSAIAGTAR